MQLKIKPCKACGLSATRKNMVIGRGTFPADILFIGEAPGMSEDVLGEAFIGEAGNLLNKLMGEIEGKPTFYITNTVMCRPIDREGTNRQPNPEEILSCRANFLSVLGAVSPKKVVFIGKVAQTYYKKIFPQAKHITHPAFMLRNGGAKSQEYKTAITELTNLYKELEDES